MKIMRITAPRGYGDLVVETAIQVDIRDISFSQSSYRDRGGKQVVVDVVDLHPSYAKGKRFLERLKEETYYDAAKFTLETASSTSLLGSRDVH